jgi:hypothetical protein
MILCTHAVVGGALASLFPSHPVAAFMVGFGSHFVVDAIPHWDYPLRSISVAPDAQNHVRLTPALARDAGLIGLDAIVGLALAIGIFATPSTLIGVLAGAVGAMLPDPLQFVHTLYPHEPLASLQRFHRWMHTKHQLHWPMGVSSQAAFAATVVGTALAIF